MKRIALLLAGVLTSAPLLAENTSHALLLSGADLYTVSHGVIEHGELLIENGKIVALGAKVAAPAGVERIDLSGKRVYPGYIAANSVLGLTEVEAVRATNDMAEVGAINANVRAAAAIDPDSELFAVARANGVLSALAVPQAGGDGVLSGQSALIQMDGWTAEDMTLKTPVGVHLFWPSTRVPAWLPPAAAEQVKEGAKKKLAALDAALRDARAYAAAHQGGVVTVPDLRMEALLPLLDRSEALFVHAQDLGQIRAALDFAVREQLRIVLVGAADAWRVAATLKARDIAVILGSAHNLPLRRWEAYDTIYSGAAKLAQAGVRFAIANDGTPMAASNERNLPYQAASYAAFGLGTEAALRAITLSPAEILGVAERLGSLDVGKDATLFVASGDALDARSSVERAWIQGREVDLANKQTRLYKKYQSKYAGQPKD